MQSVRPEPLLSEEDYGAIEAAVMETARGRWFLAEYARRNRNSDTDAVLAAIRRLERMVESAGNFETRDEVTRGMADIAQAIAAAQLTPEAPQALSAPLEASAEPWQEDTALDGTVSDEVAEIPPVAAGDEAHDAVSEGAIAAPAPETAPTEPEPLPEASPLPWPTARDDEPILEDIAFEPPPVAVTTTLTAEPEEPQTSTPEENVIRETGSGSGQLQEEAAATGLPPERDVLSELESFLAEAIPGRRPEEATTAEISIDPAPAATEPPSGEVKPDPADAGPFPILELDEAAAEALLNQDPPRHELILPANHLLTQRWHRDFGHGGADAAETAKPASEEPLRTGLVTFIDEEPVDESESVFSAPLRLEPEDAAAPEPEPAAEAAEVTIAPSRPAIVPPLTIGEIEAMPFAKKAALFS